MTVARCTGETNRRAASLGSDGTLAPLATRELFPVGTKLVGSDVLRVLRSA